MTETVLVWNGLVAESPALGATAGSASPPDRHCGWDRDAVPVVHSDDRLEHAAPWTVGVQRGVHVGSRRGTHDAPDAAS